MRFWAGTVAFVLLGSWFAYTLAEGIERFAVMLAKRDAQATLMAESNDK